MQAIKSTWHWLSGRKRHIGAILAILPQILKACGVEGETADQVTTIISLAGTALWGIGWAHAGERALIADKAVDNAK